MEVSFRSTEKHDEPVAEYHLVVLVVSTLRKMSNLLPAKKKQDG